MAPPDGNPSSGTGRPTPSAPPPILVLGLGNLLLRDDGLGLSLLRMVEARAVRWGGTVEFVDGGTQGVSLLGLFASRKAVLILDAVALRGGPGTLCVLEGARLLSALPGAAGSSHEGNAGDLLRAAALLGELPAEVVVVGLEPAEVRTGIGLSPEVEAGLPAAADAAAAIVDRMVLDVGG